MHANLWHWQLTGPHQRDVVHGDPSSPADTYPDTYGYEYGYTYGYTYANEY